MINNNNQKVCDFAGNDKNVCLKMMFVDEAKTDMEYCCNSCNKSFCAVSPLFLNIVPALSGRKAV